MTHPFKPCHCQTLAGWYYEVRISEVESCGISYCDIGGLAIGVTKQSGLVEIFSGICC